MFQFAQGAKASVQRAPSWCPPVSLQRSWGCAHLTSISTIKAVDIWKLANVPILTCVRACGCEMSQCLLRRMTSLILSLRKTGFDFLDVTVYGPSFHQLYSPCLLFCLFSSLLSPQKSWIWNQKWLVLQPVHSLGSAIPIYKRHSPGLHRLSPLFTTWISRADFSEPLLFIYLFFGGESHLNWSRKSLLDYLTSGPIRLIWISDSGTCTKAPSEAAPEANWAYYTCTSRAILVSL